MWNPVLLSKLQALHSPSFLTLEIQKGKTRSSAHFCSHNVGFSSQEVEIAHPSLRNPLDEIEEECYYSDDDQQYFAFTVYNSDGDEEETVICNEEQEFSFSTAIADNHLKKTVAKSLESAFVDAVATSSLKCSHDSFRFSNSKISLDRNSAIFSERLSFEMELDEEINSLQKEIAEVEQQKRLLCVTPVHSPSTITSPVTSSPSSPKLTTNSPSAPLPTDDGTTSISTNTTPSPSTPPHKNSAVNTPAHSSPSSPAKHTQQTPQKTNGEDFLSNDEQKDSSSATLIEDKAIIKSNSKSAPSSPISSQNSSGAESPFASQTDEDESSTSAKDKLKSNDEKSSKKRHRTKDISSTSKQSCQNNSTALSGRKPKLLERSSSSSNIEEVAKSIETSKSLQSTKRRKTCSAPNSSSAVQDVFKLEQVLKIQTSSPEGEDEEIDIL